MPLINVGRCACTGTLRAEPGDRLPVLRHDRRLLHAAGRHDSHLRPHFRRLEAHRRRRSAHDTSVVRRRGGRRRPQQSQRQYRHLRRVVTLWRRRTKTTKSRRDKQVCCSPDPTRPFLYLRSAARLIQGRSPGSSGWLLKSPLARGGGILCGGRVAGRIACSC